MGLAGAIVPIILVVAFEVVVGLGGIGAIVPRFAKVVDVGFEVRGDGVAAVRMCWVPMVGE